MASIDKIVRAWYNVIIEDPKIEALAKQRAEVCNGCEFAQESMVTKFINDDLLEVKGLICGQCKCPLTAKIRSEDICNKWKQ